MEEQQPIEVKELHSATVSAVSSPFAISWSEDNKVSVITSTSLHVIEIQPNPSYSNVGISIKRSIIRKFDDLPTQEAGIDTDKLIWQLEQEDVYHMILDRQLAPKLAGSKPLEIRIKQALWSSQGMLQTHRCLLACVSNLGFVGVYAPRLQKWNLVGNISRMWAEHCKQQWSEYNPLPKNHSNTHHIFKTLKERTSRLKTTALVWSKLMTIPQKFSFLAMGQHNGEIIIWAVSALKHCIPEEFSANLTLVHDSGLKNITALHWLQWDENTVTLLVGNHDGCAKALVLSVDGNTITFSNTLDLWSEADRMQVTHINSLPPKPGRDSRIIALSKSSYVIAFLLESNTVLATCHHLIGNLSVSGLDTVDEDRFLITTHSGYITMMNLLCQKPAELAMEIRELPSSINWKNLACYGVAGSVCRGIWAMATSICKLYDHLIFRRPGQVIFFYLQGKTDPMQSLIKNPTCRLMHHWEFLEIIRLQYLRKGTELDHLNIVTPEVLDSLNSYELRLELWISRIVLAQTLTINATAKQKKLMTHIHLLEQLLLCRHACQCITMLTHRQTSLDKDSLETLSLLRAWLQTWLTSNNNIVWVTARSVVQNTLALPVPNGIPEKESCALCGNEVVMNINWRQSMCQSGHCLHRCCRTLRQCIVQPYELCHICYATALPTTDENEDHVCVFCDSPLLLDDKIKLPTPSQDG